MEPVALLSARAPGAMIAAETSSPSTTISLDLIFTSSFHPSAAAVGRHDRAARPDLRRITRSREAWKAVQIPSGPRSTLVLPYRPTATLGGAAWRAPSNRLN